LVLQRVCKYSFFTLLGYEQVVVFLAALKDDVTSVNQICLSEYT